MHRDRKTNRSYQGLGEERMNSYCWLGAEFLFLGWGLLETGGVCPALWVF